MAQQKTDSPRRSFLRRVMGDSIWSIAGLMLMNLAAQFAVYPLWNRRLGNESYGHILFLLSAMNILAVSMGTACNYGRMKESAERETGNRTYLRMLAWASLAAVPYMIVASLLSGAGMSPAETALLVLLTVATMWRFYADVGYRLTLNYRGFFLYYLTVSLGYGVGVALFLRTGLWPLALLPGELAGLCLVLLRGHVLRPEDGEKGYYDTFYKRCLLVVTNDTEREIGYISFMDMDLELHEARDLAEFVNEYCGWKYIRKGA